MKLKESYRRAWPWAALVIVLLGCVLLLVLADHTPKRQLAKGAGSHSPVTHPNPESARANTSASSDAATQPGPIRSPGTAVKDELCGVSGLELLRAGDETLEQHVGRVMGPALSGWTSSLAASEDPRRRAIGVALANARPKPTLGEEPSKDTPANNHLVLLAIETDDPAIYALAIRQCSGGGYDLAPGPCQGISWEHWASIDPDNAIPWLWIAARAERAGDQQGVEDALAKASTATGTEAPERALDALAFEALPAGNAPLEEALAGAELISILPGGAPGAITSLCSEAAIQQSRRKQQCSAIATVLATQGSTLLDLVLASILADQLGLPQELRTALSAESQDARSTMAGSVPYPWSDLDGSSGFRCATVLRYDAYIDAIDAARGSERAALGVLSRLAHGTK